MSFQPHHLLLTVVAGECPAPELELAWGVASPRFSVGSGGDWVVRGEGVLDVHLYLSFDGRRLRVATADRAATATAQGAELGAEWRELAPPFELSFGSARLAGHVGLASSSLPDFSTGRPRHEPRLGLPASDLQTRLIDLSALREPPVEQHATVNVGGALETQAPPLPPARPQSEDIGADPPELARPFQVVSGATRVWSFGTPQPEPPSPSLHPADPGRAPQPTAPSPPMLNRTVCDKGALRDYARQLATGAPQGVSDGAGSERASQAGSLRRAAAARTRHRASAFVRSLPRRWAGLRRALAAPPIRRRLIALSALAGLALLPWLLATPSTARGSRTATTPEPPRKTSEPLTEPIAEAVTPSVAEPDAGAPPPARARAQRSKGLEHAAFRAAFNGNVSEAVTLYEQLASDRTEPVFGHAARLLRQNRVYKP